ncbi:hypothetical protein [Mesorhizobium sp.]|uniref:hypothetical protein n=1 Tax=Mesorhizobium sp. TaxID=1871066 RepID=UPI000FE33E91|nr:hypothetical protein [Mesorhizobium sp.]RWK07339.1 MAG: hypothetical protein EOR42_07695 [Mesorhizobium sp.]
MAKLTPNSDFAGAVALVGGAFGRFFHVLTILLRKLLIAVDFGQTAIRARTVSVPFLLHPTGLITGILAFGRL